jgi:hypothetical protein
MLEIGERAAMMFPEPVIKLAHDKADAICARAARAIHAAGIKSFLGIPLQELGPRLKPTLKKQLHYLEHQDMEAWRTFTIEVVESRIQHGMTAWDLIQAGQTMLGVLDDFYESELSVVKVIEGQDATKVLRRIKARIQGMNAVATAVATSVGIKHVK